MSQDQCGILVLGRARRWRGHELQIVHDDETDLPERVQALEHRLKVFACQG
jgi:hypothetical protein